MKTNINKVVLGLMVASMCLVLFNACKDNKVGDTLTGGGESATKLEIIQGNNQTAAVGESVSIPPEVRVLDSNGNSLAGVPIKFTVISGGGKIGEDLLTTNQSGIVHVSTWILGSTIGTNILEARVENGNAFVRITASAFGNDIVAPAVSIGPEGGILYPDLTGSGLEGLTIHVPMGAYKQSTSFVVSTLSLPSNPTLQNLDLISVIRINNNGAISDSLITVRVPLNLEENEFGTAYWYDETIDLFDPVPVINSTHEYIELITDNFNYQGIPSLDSFNKNSYVTIDQNGTDILLSPIHTDYLLNLSKDKVNSDFKLKKDDWVIPNIGSELTPGGNCVGHTFTMAYFYKNKSGNANLRKFELTPPIDGLKGLDNHHSRRLVSLVQYDYIKMKAVYSQEIKFFNSSDAWSNWLLLLHALHKTKQPQMIYILDANIENGHAFLAISADPETGSIFFVDPNNPGKEFFIKFNKAAKEYNTIEYSPSGDGENIIFNRIRYMPNSLHIPVWDATKTRWMQFEEAWNSGEDGRLGDDVFSDYNITIEGVPYTKNMSVYADSITVAASPNPMYSRGNNGLVGKEIVEQVSYLVPLDSTVNKYTKNSVPFSVRGLNGKWLDGGRLSINRGIYKVAHSPGSDIIKDAIELKPGRWYDFKLIGDNGTPISYLDYNKIEIKPNSNLSGKIEFDKRIYQNPDPINRGFFRVKLLLDEGHGLESAEFDVYYRGIKIQTIEVIFEDFGLFGLWEIDGSNKDVYSITSIDGYRTISMLWYEEHDGRCFDEDQGDILDRVDTIGYIYESDNWGGRGDYFARFEFIKVNANKFELIAKLISLENGAVDNFTLELNRTDSLPTACR